MPDFEGRILRFDLDRNIADRARLDNSIIRDYIGGRGYGAYFAFNDLPVHVDPLSPSNLIMFLTGPLAGTPFPGTGKFVVVTRSPATGTFCDSHASGLLAPQLRFAGIDALIISGKAIEPVYLWIDDDKVEIRSAVDLWGKDTFEAERQLRDRHGHDVGVAVIGPAGEKLVKFASIGSDYYRQAARGGVGAVMGSKNLKAVVVRGTKGIPIADQQKMLELQQVQLAKLPNSPGAQARKKFGTTFTFTLTNAAGMLPTRNFQQGTFPEGSGKLDSDGMLEYTTGIAGCYGCMMPCSRLIEVPYDGKKIRLEGPEYETLSMLGSNIGVDDPGVVAHLNLLCDRQGMDTISAGSVIAFTMECVERGILKDSSLVDLRFGNGEAAGKVLMMIAGRQGIGELMAEGVRKMSQQIGYGSERFAMQTKGLELPGYDPRAGFGTALTYAITPRGGCHRRAWPPAREILGNVPPYTVQGKAAMVKETIDQRAILHSLVACDFHTDALPISMTEYRDFVAATTGYSYSLEEWTECAERIETTIRLYNQREGFTRADDNLPTRLLAETLPDGPAKGQSFGQEGLGRMLDEYYALRGWDNQGVPLSETIERFRIPLRPDKYD